MSKLVEQIILKVGVDTSAVAAQLAGLNKKIDASKKKFDGLAGSTEENTAAQKKAIPVAKKTGVAMGDLDKKLDKTEGGFNKLTKALKKYKKESKGASKGSKSIGGGLAMMGGALAGLGAIAVVTDRLKELTQAGQDADRLGVVTQDLIDLQNVGKQFGVTAEDVTQGIKNINESASEAGKEGKGEKFELFKELNIDLVEFNKLKPDEQLESFSKSINGVKNQGRRTAIQLALMGEEGFKLSTTFDELAKGADAAKNKVRGLTGTMDPEKIAKMNERVSEMKLRFDGLINGLLDHGSTAFFNISDSVETLIFSMYGLNKAQEDYNDLMIATRVEARRAMAELHAVAREKERQAKDDERRQLILNRLRREAMEELNDPERLKSIEDSPEIQKKVAQEKKRLRALEVDEEIEKGRKLSRKEASAKKSAMKAIEEVGASRKKERLKRLQEESKNGSVSTVEAGSVEAAEIAAQLETKDAAKIDKIDRLKQGIEQENKAREVKKLKVAEDTLKAIIKLEKKKPNKIVKGNLS